MLSRILLILVLLIAGTCTSAAANDELDALAWLEGHWVTEAFGGTGEEIWLPASGDAMHCVFRLTVEGELNFSEFIQVTVEAGQVVMRFKHFQADYSTWEGEGAPMELAATEITSDRVVFEGTDEKSSSRIVYMQVGDELHVTVAGVDEVLRFRRK